MQKAHSSLGASSAHRWLACPGSIRLSENIPPTTNKYAQEGTAAHELASDCLIGEKDAADFLGTTIVVDKGKSTEASFEVTEDMADAVQIYLDAVRECIKEYAENGYNDWDLQVEVKFDLSHIYPGMFGTCDCVLYLPQWKKMHVFDYKHGWKSVDAERNPQTMYYALGALTGKHNRAIDELECVIVQPRSTKNPVKAWGCDVVDLMDFRADLVEGAKKTEDPNAEINPGDWCKYCPAAAICPEREKLAYENACADFDIDGTVKLMEPAKMDKSKLKLAWENAEALEDWISSVKAFAKAQALAGEFLPGTKLVRGRKGARKWRDEEETKKVLRPKLGAQIFNEKLKTPTQLDKLLAASEKGLLDELVTQSEGGLSLVLDSDPRPSATVSPDEEF